MDVDLLGNTVYQRTHKGQIVCSGRASSMDAQFVMWLRMFNGLTPTQTLLGLAAVTALEARSTIEKLLSLGLIEPVSPVAPERQRLQ